MNKNEMNEKELEKISGGFEYAPGYCSHLGPKDFDGQYENWDSEHSTLTWGQELDVNIPSPVTKQDTLHYNGKHYKPAFVHFCFHNTEVVWKDYGGNYLIPSGLSPSDD